MTVLNRACVDLLEALRWEEVIEADPARGASARESCRKYVDSIFPVWGLRWDLQNEGSPIESPNSKGDSI